MGAGAAAEHQDCILRGFWRVGPAEQQRGTDQGGILLCPGWLSSGAIGAGGLFGLWLARRSVRRSRLHTAGKQQDFACSERRSVAHGTKGGEPDPVLRSCDPRRPPV